MLHLRIARNSSSSSSSKRLTSLSSFTKLIAGDNLAMLTGMATSSTKKAALSRTYSSFLLNRPRNDCLGMPSLMSRRSLFIQTELTPNTNSIKFKPGKQLIENGDTHEFLSRRDAMKSPLATDLFAISGVEGLMFGSDFITVTKEESANWQLMKPDIFGCIMDAISSNKPLFHLEEKDTTIKVDDSEVVAMIKELLDTRIRPSIQDDGGDVEYIDFVDGVVKLKLRGACRTCDSSSLTLKNGIEKMLMHYVPEVEEVVQVLEEHEEISKNEFEKLEKSLRLKMPSGSV